ncbi:AraC family transcriptional regulator [Dinghuibacter silviterrae]|uniref:AraC family transcriptional regulator n=1 Tax=Dinghuibacter silviterrae TaxID=1539049 RepID=A0A4R8DIN3_9BACT|nr:AraC family transcriptional regulator [Dinghuibacter silviterrae]TDW97619.1 AraC family transcriptional regulator [Dinghuibacter silviterrae]
MRAELLKVPRRPDDSFSVRQHFSNQVNNRWHYHVELELIHIHRGSGTQFVGDNIKRFDAGDIVLVGSNLPHFWRYDHPETDAEAPYSTVIHFRDDLWGVPFLHLPELRPVKALLTTAGRGILIQGKREQQRLGALIGEVRAAEGLDRLLRLLKVLGELAAAPRPQLLSSIGFQPVFTEGESERINAIYDFTLQHFPDNIYLEDVSRVAQLVPNSFCRYFKAKTGKTYSQFVTEIRVGHACKLLIEGKDSIKQVCYASGFNNFTSFNAAFKRITGQVPQAYQRAFVER